MAIKSLQLLETLLAGHHLTIDEVEELVQSKVREDLHLEYKHGDELLNKDANSTIREYASGFANSAGGVLIIGIDAPAGIPTQITGCNGHKKGQLGEWGARCLTEIANYFSPPPRFQVVTHSQGDVLIVIVPRSLGLVPTLEAGKIFYYFRLHDQMLKAPDYLMADLLVGRRQRPIFAINDFKLLNFARVFDNPEGAMDLAFDLMMRFENQSMVWAESSRWGLIAWVKNIDSPSSLEWSQPSPHLISFIDLREINPERYNHPKSLPHYHGTVAIEKPFDMGNAMVRLVLPLRFHDNWFSYTWKAALYLTAKNTLPTWYQVSIVVTTDTVKFVDEKRPVTSVDRVISIENLDNTRPLVAWENL